MWFFGAYQPALTTNDRSVNESTAATRLRETATTRIRRCSTSRGTSRRSSATARACASPTTTARLEDQRPAAGAERHSIPAGTNYSKISEFPNYSVSGNLDWVASLEAAVRHPRRLLHVATSTTRTSPKSRAIIWTTTNNIGFLDVPASLQRGTGFTSIPTNTKVTRDQQTRLYFQADSTVYARAGGEHQFKFGVQADQVGNNVLERRVAQPA